jgi:hypothetical protein
VNDDRNYVSAPLATTTLSREKHTLTSCKTKGYIKQTKINAQELQNDAQREFQQKVTRMA